MLAARSKAGPMAGGGALITGHGSSTAVAAWPSGASLLAQAIDACRRSQTTGPTPSGAQGGAIRARQARTLKTEK